MIPISKTNKKRFFQKKIKSEFKKNYFTMYFKKNIMKYTLHLLKNK